MRFYIATKLENHRQHNIVRDALLALGHEITYDWTTHGSVWHRGMDAIADIAIKEMQGVIDADFVVVLLTKEYPNGRGTHVELGAAIAAGKPVYLITDNPNHLDAHPDTCAFYHHPLIHNELPPRWAHKIEYALKCERRARGRA